MPVKHDKDQIEEILASGGFMNSSSAKQDVYIFAKDLLSITDIYCAAEKVVATGGHAHDLYNLISEHMRARRVEMSIVELTDITFEVIKTVQNLKR